MEDYANNGAGEKYALIDQRLADLYFAECYEALLQIARQRRRRSRMHDTFGTVDILHETYLRMTGKPAWQSRQHFLSTAALAMRQVIIDHARRKAAAKRSSGLPDLSLDNDQRVFPEFNETPEQIVVIGDILEQLGEANPRWLRILDCRYFAGMTEAETAETLGVSERTVRRDWVMVRGWLADRMAP
ncbi:ECF-type sigma factor [Hyphomonas sp.]|uniref:ECF-type sigma factor n=1 Tax=Hyphomonas sp. TaxID=87 RepID=UPI00391C3CAB